MAKDNRKNGTNTGSRGGDGKFGPGNPGKPKGVGHFEIYLNSGGRCPFA
jgi:hypothetical protein